MRILHLAWEYPPVLYGGLGRHVHALATAQAAQGHDVMVITQAPTGPSGRGPEDDGSVTVLRTSADPIQHDPSDLLAHVAHMEWAFVDAGEELLAAWEPDVLHAHDWMVSHAAVSLRHSAGVPVVATIHATEAGRNAGWVTTDLSTRIHGLEWWLVNTADVVITCSQAMRIEVESLFGRDDATVIANGIARSGWQSPNGSADRMRQAHAPDGPLITYTGRIEYEKGVQVLLDAMPGVLRAHPDARLVVAGRGRYLPDLEARAQHLGLGDSARFLGWVSEHDLRALVAAADVAVAPSLYEPFGLVALEAAALGTPVIVAETGGLAEFATGGELATTFPVGDAAGLARAIVADLDDPAAATSRAGRATRALAERFDWEHIAARTVAAYRTAIDSLAAPPFDARLDRAATRHLIEPPAFTAPMGRLLDT